MDEEVVALYDDGGRPAGNAPRSRDARPEPAARRDRHHRPRPLRTRSTSTAGLPTKDVYPAHWDFTAGGVVLAGEDPFEGARRELAEELGVTSELESLGESDYADSQTSVPRLPLPDDLGRAHHAAAGGGRVRRVAQHRAAPRPDERPRGAVHARRPARSSATGCGSARRTTRRRTKAGTPWPPSSKAPGWTASRASPTPRCSSATRSG